MLIKEGVQIYMSRTIPVILLFLVSAGGYVFVTAGWGTLTCFGAGALLNLLSAWVGVRTTVQGTCRLATLLGENLSRSVRLGMWTGSIGGLLSTSLALGGLLPSIENSTSFPGVMNASHYALEAPTLPNHHRMKRRVRKDVQSEEAEVWRGCGSGFWTPLCSRALAPGPALSPSTCAWAGASSPRAPTWAPWRHQRATTVIVGIFGSLFCQLYH